MLGERLKLLRLEKQLTQQQIAKDLSVSQQTYSFYESEKRTPDYKTLLLIAKYHNVLVSYLLGEIDVRQIPNTMLNQSLQASTVTSINQNTSILDELDEEGNSKAIDYLEYLKQKHGKK